MEKLDWSINVSVALGPKLAPKDSLILEAYDKIKVTIDSGATTLVDLQGGTGTEVKFLLMVADAYATDMAALTYLPSGGAITTAVSWDAPLLLIGEGNLSLFGDASTVTIENGLQNPVTIEILVGRDAATTPPPSQ